LSVTCDRSVVSSTNTTDRHDITEILLKVALNTINQTYIQQKWTNFKGSLSGANIGAIVGGTLGGIVFVVILVLGVIYIIRQRTDNTMAKGSSNGIQKST
jgi:hypothetical protein